MQVFVLGSLVLNDDDGAPVHLGGVKRKELFLRLLMSANTVVASEHLRYAVWRESGEEISTATLHSHMANLRRNLPEGRIETRSPGYLLRVDPQELDALTAEALLSKAKSDAAGGDLTGAASLLDSTIAMWRGPALCDVADRPWAAAWVARVTGIRQQCVDALLEIELKLGRYLSVVTRAEAELVDAPLDEGIWARLMEALALSGRQTEALAAYERIRRQLADELGIDPGPELRELETRVLRQELLPTAPAPPTVAKASTTPRDGADLPAGSVTFVFTDVQGSTRLFHQLGPEFPVVLTRVFELQCEAFGTHGGVEVKREGDGLFFAFGDAGAAIAACAQAVCAVSAANVGVSVRVGLHTGWAEPVAGDYIALAVHQAARIAAAANGGQILVSGAAVAAAGQLTGIGLRDLGEFRLRDFDGPHRLWQVVAEGLPASFPPPRTPPAVPVGLGVARTTFIGRQADLRAIEDGLEHSRCVTLVGPGGVGKTRLVSEAAELEALRNHTLYFVPVAAATSPAEVHAALGSALGLRESAAGDPMAALTDHLSAVGPVVIVLDNCEQVVEACADLVDGVLAAVPQALVLATSRRPLGVADELVVSVEPLDVPAANCSDPGEALRYDAVQLFVERARRADPMFVPVRENLRAVVGICRAVDGVPLGLELAAARLRAFNVEELASRLGDVMSALGTGPRSAPERHRTLAAALRWSYDLLEPPERTLWEQLSVFAGGFTVASAEIVAEPRTNATAVFDSLGSLVENSIVVRVMGGSAQRYAMHESVRQFGVGRLDESGARDATLHRFMAWSGTVADRCAEITSDTRAEADLESDNLWAALQLAVQNADEDLVARLAVTCAHHLFLRGSIRRSSACLELAQQAVHDSSPARLALLDLQTWIAAQLHATEETERLARDMLQLADRLDDTAHSRIARRLLAAALLYSGRGALARTELESLVREIDADDDWGAPGTLGCLSLLATCAAATGDAGAAVEYGQREAALGRRAGSVRLEAIGEFISGVAVLDTDPRRSVDLLGAAVEAVTRIDDRPAKSVMDAALALAIATVGDNARAWQYVARSAAGTTELGEDGNASETLDFLARAVLTLGEPELARRLLGAADTCRVTHRQPRLAHEERGVSGVRAERGPSHDQLVLADVLEDLQRAATQH